MTTPAVLCVTLNPVLDTTYFVDRFAPVYRTDAGRVTHVAGGKGNNVARALALLGVRAHSLVALGGLTGRAIASLMYEEAFESTAAWVSGESRAQSTVVDAAGEQRAFFAPSAPFFPSDNIVLRTHFGALLNRAGMVCLCGSAPDGDAAGLFGTFVHRAALHGVPSLLDSSGEALRRGLSARPDIVKVNRAEAAGWLGRQLARREDELTALAALRGAVNRWAILTLGGEGALFAAEDGVWHAAPPAVTAVNPIASGDAMTAGLVAGLQRGLSPEDAFRLGMGAAAANTLTWEACRFDPAVAENLAREVVLTRV